jgi:flagellar biosynthesis protein FliP
MHKRLLLFSFVLLACLFLGDCLHAQEPSSPSIEQLAPTPTILEELTAITAFALLPFAIMLLTSYIKIVIVLSLLRNALGIQQSPPNQVISGIALLMTIYVMFPTAVAMYKAGENQIKDRAPTNLFSAESAQYMVEIPRLSTWVVFINSLNALYQKSFEVG